MFSLNFIHNINYQNENNIFKSLIIKDNVEYYCERIRKENKNGFIKTNNKSFVKDYIGFEYDSEDPRLFLLNNDIYIIFNIKNNETNGRDICISKYDDFKPKKLFIEGIKMNSIEKNWSPFVKNNTLYLVYCYNPLIIVSYDLNEEGKCKIVYKEENVQLPLESFWKVVIRGSTNLVQYKDDFYIGLAHTTIWADRLNIGNCSYPYYQPLLIMLDTNKWKITYLSKPILLEYKEKDINTIDNFIFEENDWHCVIYPTSINKLNNLEFITTFNINEKKSLKYLLKIDNINVDESITDINQYARNESIKTIKSFTKFKNDTYF